jgi:hypothetical protein
MAVVSQDDTFQLHNRFRHSLSLLMFATSFNSDLPLLIKDNGGVSKEKSFEKFSTPGVLNALSTLFVRGHEIIAVTNITDRTVVSSVTFELPGKTFATTYNTRRQEKESECASPINVVPPGRALKLDPNDDWDYLYANQM